MLSAGRSEALDPSYGLMLLQDEVETSQIVSTALTPEPKRLSTPKPKAHRVPSVPDATSSLDFTFSSLPLFSHADADGNAQNERLSRPTSHASPLPLRTLQEDAETPGALASSRRRATPVRAYRSEEPVPTFLGHLESPRRLPSELESPPPRLLGADMGLSPEDQRSSASAPDEAEPEDIESCDREIERLQALYDAEVGRSADLRDSLEEKSSLLRSIKGPMLQALEESSNGVQEIATEDARAQMMVEDEIAKNWRSLDTAKSDVEALAFKINSELQDYQLMRQQKLEELQIFDGEIASLRSEVESREEAIVALSTDVKSAIDYMVSANVEAAGGLDEELSGEHFMPKGVLEHLALSEHGLMHLQIVKRKFQLLVADRRMQHRAAEILESTSATVDDTGGADPLHSSLLMSALSERAEGRLMSKEFSLPGLSREAAAEVCQSVVRDLEELRQCLGLETLTDSSVEASDAAKEYLLLRAVAVGDLEGLTAAASTVSPQNEVMGWTEWHVAAGFGQASALERLVEDANSKGMQLEKQLTRTNLSGLSPLGVACVLLHVDCARCLIEAKASVDVGHPDESSPLVLARACAIAEFRREGRGFVLSPGHMEPKSEELVQLLLESRTDTVVPGSSEVISQAMGSTANPTEVTSMTVESVTEPYYSVLTIGSQESAWQSNALMSFTWRMLKAASRDGAGFMREAKARQLARLSREEEAQGVFSASIANFTHAGLKAALEVPQPAFAPNNSERNAQVLVITSDRLLLFHASTWSLACVVAISELAEAVLPAFSETAFILRMHGLPDMVLDSSSRKPIIDELSATTHAVSDRWGGAEFGAFMRVQVEKEPIIPLLDEKQNRMGTLVFAEKEMLLLLPFASNSLLLAGQPGGGSTFFFSFLDLHQSIQGPAGYGSIQWKWQPFFFVLTTSSPQASQLNWCRHPNDARPLGSLLVSTIRDIQVLDHPEGDCCLILEYEVMGTRRAMTLRARSAHDRQSSMQLREEWLVSLRAVRPLHV